MDTPLLHVRNLTKRFPGTSSAALDNISFELNKDQLLCILGPNGAGKTTLLKILATLILPESGSLRLGSVDVLRQPEAAKPLIGFTPDDMRSFYWRLTGSQNLNFFASLHGFRNYRDTLYARQLVRLFQVDFLEKRFDSYSNGMKKRLLLMRSLLHDPQILLLDEPSKGLDHQAKAAFTRFMKEELIGRRGKTILVSTHQVEEYQDIAESFLILSAGRQLAFGSREELGEQTGFRGSSISEIFTQLIHPS